MDNSTGPNRNSKETEANATDPKYLPGDHTTLNEVDIRQPTVPVQYNVVSPTQPGQYTTTTIIPGGYPNTTTTAGYPEPYPPGVIIVPATQEVPLKFDPSYLKTPPGIIKCLQVLANFLGAVCIGADRIFFIISRGVYFHFVSLMAFWVTLGLLACYLFHVVEKYNTIPWLHIECGYCVIWSLLYIVAASLAVSFPFSEAFIAAGVKMADPGFPGQHTTTTTVQSSNTVVTTSVRFDINYIKTLPGLLKCIQLALNLLGFICIECSGLFATHTRGSFFNFVAMFAFWFTGILLGLYFFHIIEKTYRIPWLKIEFVFCAIWTGFYLIASSLAVSFVIEAFIAAGFFGFCAMVAYGVDAFLKFKAIQAGQLAQGERVMSKQTTTISSPAY